MTDIWYTPDVFETQFLDEVFGKIHYRQTLYTYTYFESKFYWLSELVVYMS